MLTFKRMAVAFVPVLTLSGLLFLSGCPEQKVVTCKSNEEFNARLGICVPCPAGTKLDKSVGKCKPVDVEDTSVVVPDTWTPDWGVKDDTPEPDLINPDLGQPDFVIPDLVVDTFEVVVPTGEVGSSCSTNTDCDPGLSCFDWPGGYCVQTSCASSKDCPEGSFCLPLLENGQACFQGCAETGHCRPGYGCKAISELGGVTQQICHPLTGDNLALGKMCEDAAQCAGSMACEQLGPVRMCTISNCSNVDPCPEGSVCIALTSVPVCLPSCVVASDCDKAFDDAIDCQETKDIFGGTAKVCTSSNIGMPIGNQCYFNSECATGYCHLLFTGKCTDTGKACSSDRDCEQGFCMQDPASQKGICSKGCGSSDPCPTGNLCVMSGTDAVCMPNCSVIGATCGPPGFGMQCTIGMVTWPPANSGKLACVRNMTGDAGTDCDAHADCLKGECYFSPGEDGYCMGTCVSANQCTFGSDCYQGQCRRMCMSDEECPETLECRTEPGSSQNICAFPL